MLTAIEVALLKADFSRAEEFLARRACVGENKDSKQMCTKAVGCKPR